MNLNKKRVAFFKVRTTSALPRRQGPVQCIRNCTNCTKRNNDLDGEFEDLISIKSHDNLVSRKALWFSKYQSIQYHIGQIDVLKKTLQDEVSWPTLYVVAATSSNDLNFLDMVLSYMQLQTVYTLDNSKHGHDIIHNLKTKKAIAVPIQLRSCVTDNFITKKNDICIGSKALRDLIEPIILWASNNPDFGLNIVPVAISKDHDRLMLFGLGSLGIQILEPYSLQEYIIRLQTKYKSTHLVQHLYYDVARNVAIFPSHLVAFLILYLERKDGVRINDLTIYMDWFRKVSIDTGMQIGFTGDSLCAIEFALMILNDFIYSDPEQIYRAKDVEGLMNYANLITPMIVYYGLMGRAILDEYNKNETIDIKTILTPNLRVKIMKEKVLETCRNFAEKVEQRIPCRRPCSSIETCIADTFNQMQMFGRYFNVVEPKIKSYKNYYWASDFDSEDEYSRHHRDNPSLKSWILLTDREYRLDRLNLFINAVEPYI